MAKFAAVPSFIAPQSVRSVGMKQRGGQEISDRIFFHLQIVLLGFFLSEAFCINMLPSAKMALEMKIITGKKKKKLEEG